MMRVSPWFRFCPESLPALSSFFPVTFASRQYFDLASNDHLHNGESFQFKYLLMKPYY